MPVVNDDLNGVSEIANQPCVDPRAKGAQPSSALASLLAAHTGSSTDAVRLAKLQIELNEAKHKANETFETMKQWLVLLGSSKDKLLVYARRLQIPTLKHGALNTEQNSRLRVLEQLSNYAYFLTKQEEDKAYQTDGAALIRNLRNQIMRVLCILRDLLPLPDDDVVNFVSQDVAEHLFSLETMDVKDAVKRAVCSTAVRVMFGTLQRITVSVETGSVIIPDDM